MVDHNDLSIEEAKKRLEKAAQKIKERNGKSDHEEPKHLRSGELDELELERRKKGKDHE
ncbi:hypothetical protein NBRC116494_23420 [Aurantivibrio plasticivorans]